VKLYIVTIKDKCMMGEPDIGLAVVEALSEAAALRSADDWINLLAYQGRGRCVANAREITPGAFYRTLALVRPPIAQSVDKETL
jgi:hypothetical protein